MSKILLKWQKVTSVFLLVVLLLNSNLFLVVAEEEENNSPQSQENNSPQTPLLQREGLKEGGGENNSPRTDDLNGVSEEKENNSPQTPLLQREGLNGGEVENNSPRTDDLNGVSETKEELNDRKDTIDRVSEEKDNSPQSQENNSPQTPLLQREGLKETENNSPKGLKEDKNEINKISKLSKKLAKANLSEERKAQIANKLEQFKQKENSKALKQQLKNYKQAKQELRQQLKEQLKQASSKTEKKTIKADFKAEQELIKQEINSLKNINELIKQDFEQNLNELFTAEEKELVSDLEPNYLFELQEEIETSPLLEKTERGVSPNDTEYANQWEIASILGDEKASPLLGEIERGNPTIIALIDTGVDYNHEDLQGQFWTAENCVNDLNEAISGGCTKGGYDFVDEDTDPLASDNYAHGTQVAGILNAKTNNSLGIASLSNNQAKIMALRVANDGILELDKIIKAVYFAVNNGASIINMSFGGTAYSENLKTAIAYAKDKGVIVVAAAGNYGTNNDLTPIYPASYELENIISVGALDQNDELAVFSNYGVNSVDIVAPGAKVFTTGLNNSYQQISGTSFSAPLVVAGFVYYLHNQ